MGLRCSAPARSSRQELWNTRTRLWKFGVRWATAPEKPRFWREIATGYNAAGDKEKALQYAQQAHDAYHAAGDRRGEAISLIGIGDIYASLRDKRAMDDYSQALAIARQSNFPRILAIALNKIGTGEYALGENQKALENFTRGPADLSAHEHVRRSWIDNEQHRTRVVRPGRKREGARLLHAGIAPILRTAGDRSGEATVLNNMGMVYQSLGDRHKAIDYYNQALPILTAVGDRASEDMVLNNMGAAYVELGDKEKAIEVLNQAIALQTGAANSTWRRHCACERGHGVPQDGG